MKESKPSPVCVYKIEYEILPSMTSWTAFVAAFSHEEAVAHVMRTVGKPVHIMASGLQSRLDDLSTEVRRNVIMRWTMTTPVPIAPSKVEDEKVNEDEIGKKTNISRLEEAVIEENAKKAKKIIK